MVEKERFRRPSWPTINLQRRRSTVGCGLRRTSRILRICCESANDPVYGKEALNKTRQRRNGPPQSSKGFPPFKSKFDSFVTGLDTVPKPPSSHGTGSSNQNVSARRCPLCEKSHDLEDCDAYKKKSVEQRKSFLSEKALCYACYGKNHLSKNCTKKRTCKKCKRPHPTLLHIEGFSLDKESGAVNRETSGNDKPLKVNNARVDIPQESNLENDILLQTILPVVLTERHQQGSEDVCILW